MCNKKNQKNIKQLKIMRNLFKFVFLLCIMTSKFVFAQETDICNISLNNKSMQLYKNENFQKLVLLDNGFFQRKIDKDLLDRISKEREGFVNEKNYEEISSGLGFGSVDEMMSYYENMNNLFNELNKVNIRSYSSEDIQNAAVKVLCDNNSSTDSKLAPPTKCQRAFRNCNAIAVGTAVGGHVACATADITIIAGVFCHSAVHIVMSAMLDDCRMDLDDCK